MIELILEWCGLKRQIAKRETNIIFKQGDVWRCTVGVNIGEEIFGKGIKFTRPVVVFKKFTRNSFLGIPVTSQKKHGSWYVEISMHNNKNWAMLNQIRIFDKKRLTNRIGTLNDCQYQLLKEKFVSFYTF